MLHNDDCNPGMMSKIKPERITSTGTEVALKRPVENVGFHLIQGLIFGGLHGLGLKTMHM